MTSTTIRTATRSQRRGSFWQDWYAAWLMLSAWSEPSRGIVSVEPEARGAPCVDDIVVEYGDRTVFYQLKHSTTDQPFVASMLLTADDRGQSLLQKLFAGWQAIRNRRSVPFEIRLVTSMPASSDARNRTFVPSDFDRLILQPARDPKWLPTGPAATTVAEFVRTLNTDTETVLAFLRVLKVEFDAPGEVALQKAVVQILRSTLRPAATAEAEAATWVLRVYDLSTDESAPALTVDEIGRELRKIFNCPLVMEHRLALPECHTARRVVAENVLDAARAKSSGYVLVLGPPGCGKTTLATWIADTYPNEVLVRYHAYAPPLATVLQRQRRRSALEFVTTMLDVLAARAPRSIMPCVPAESNLADAARVLSHNLEILARDGRRFVIVDGVDHVLRAGGDGENLFTALPEPAPPGVVFILFGQPGWNYPQSLVRNQTIAVPPFDRNETRQHVLDRLGWRQVDLAALAVADRIHFATAGNPLSLFYSIQQLKMLAGGPDEVGKQLDSVRLFGDQPHIEYRRLLDEVREALPRPLDSKSLRDDLVQVAAESSVGLTTSRLAKAFSDEPLTNRQALDFFNRLRPIVVEGPPGEFCLFHDDFRRFVQSDATDAQRQAANGRLGNALLADWRREELLPLVEHLWHGCADFELANLPGTKDLTDWLAAADEDDVVELHRFAVAASLRAGLDNLAFKNALAGIRAAEIAEIRYRPPWLPAPRLGLRGWTFVVPPDLGSRDCLDIRAQALRAAANGIRADPQLSKEIAARFLLPKNLHADPTFLGDHSHADYVRALVDWGYRAGQPGLLLEHPMDDNVNLVVAQEIGDLLSSEQAPEIAGHWAKTLAGRNEYLDWILVGAATEQSRAGRLAPARAIAEALSACEACTDATKRASAILWRIACGTEVGIIARPDFPVYLPLSPDGVEWRDFYFHGFAAGASRHVLDLSAAMPSSLRERFSQGAMQYRLTAIGWLWRLGLACGLSVVSPDLVPVGVLRRILDVFSGQTAGGVDVHGRYALKSMAQAFMPIAMSVFSEQPALRQTATDAIARAIHDTRDAPSATLLALLEALWRLDQERWRAEAQRAHAQEALSASSGHERTDWFSYFIERGDERGTPAPDSFRRRSLTAGLTSERKTDPASFAVDLLAKLPRDQELAQAVRSLVDALVQLSVEGEGGRPAYAELPRVLGVALVHDAALFFDEFIRATSDYTVAEPFGDTAAATVRALLRLRPELRIDEVAALWQWAAACPGSYGRESSFLEAGDGLADSAEKLGVRDLAALVRTTLEPLRAIQDPQRDSIGATDEVEPSPDVANAEVTWLSPSYSSRHFGAVKGFLASGGEAAWRQLRSCIADRLAKQDFVHWLTFDYVVDGMIELRPIDTSAAFLVALDHLKRKTRFQSAPAPRAAESHPGMRRLDAIVGLIARGLEVRDAETVTRSMRALGWLARYSGGTALAVQRAAVERLRSSDTLLVRSALSILNQVRDPEPATIVVVRDMLAHEDAWCRWTAAQICQVEPIWPRPIGGPVLVPPMIAADPPPTRNGNNTFFATPAEAVTQYSRRLGSVAGSSSGAMRSRIEAELARQPELPPRPLGWEHPRGCTIASNGASAAAGRVVNLLLHQLDREKRSALLATIAAFDPWLAVADTDVPAPDGWVELCGVTVTHGPNTQMLRSLAIVPQAALAEGTAADRSELIAAVCCRLLHPTAPEPFAWVADEWPEMASPELPEGPATPLAFWNSPFTCLVRDRFILVPRWDQGFDDISFSSRPRPAWVHPELGPVIVAARGERTASTMRGIGHADVDWWTAWFVNPAWLSTSVPIGARLVRFSATQIARETASGRGDEPEVSYAADEVVGLKME